MENIGYYLDKFKEVVKEGWKLFFENTKEVRAHHLLSLLASLVVVYFLLRLMAYLFNFFIRKIFKPVLLTCILVAAVWLLYMLLFDRTKFHELTRKKGNNGGGKPPPSDNN
ncbi:MAG: hypothetical protein I3273_05185 [Candidatus Moeniiplasma glomeromycotorum]|nr:hypothetical protein [Candidatus Moeniiplasma glomeromycotorum]MCE8168308.1 hypothetical protein [Candidatus Moeniiplasma glomeromycotorum]MCE8169487.1 hypothetical protein [Candidatus Moeniiplasma glomeromycotorum]